MTDAVGQNPLTMPTDEAAKVIRRRRAEAVAGAIKPTKMGWARAFQAVILYYEGQGDMAMADLLRLDLDRYMRQAEQVARDKAMKEAG